MYNLELDQCCGSGSARICIHLAFLDPDLYWKCRAGSRRMEKDQNLQIYLVSCLLKRPLYLRSYVFLTYYLPKVYFSSKNYSFCAMLRIRDVYPGSRILIFTHSGSRISDPGSRIQKQQQKRGMKKKFVSTFFVATNFTKFENYFIF
jgi:hypothetical protein